jgi:aldose 1-epimerase
MPPIELRHGPHAVTLRPDLGGRVVRWTADGRDVFARFRARESPGWAFPPGGCFPLVPWSNRVRDGLLRHAGHDRLLTPNPLERGHAHHGHGVYAAWGWTPSAEGGTMTLEHPAGGDGWPWPYRAEQDVRLGDHGLSLRLRLTNRAAEPMPCGLGWHPYFPAGAELGFTAAAYWPSAEGPFPTGPRPLPPELRRDRPAPPPPGLDTGFSGWDGRARLRWPDGGADLRLHASGGLDHVLLYTPPDRDWFCFEPVSHAVGAMHLPDPAAAGWRTLAPGATWEVALDLLEGNGS